MTSNKSLDAETQRQAAASPRVLCSGQLQRWAPRKDMSDFRKRGLDLAEELRRLSKNYHVKSDEHDILEYEAACVEARVEFISTGTAIPENLQESPLLVQWGSRLRVIMPAVFARVESFYEEFPRVLAPNNSLQARRP